jgi:hypothetical protein
VALDSLVTVLVRAGELRREIDDLWRRVHDAEAERDQARREVGLVLRKKRALIALADDSRAAELAYRAYRKVRRRG